MLSNGLLSSPMHCADTRLSPFQPTSIFTHTLTLLSQGSVTPITRGTTLAKVVFLRDVQEMQAGSSDDNNLG